MKDLHNKIWLVPTNKGYVKTIVKMLLIDMKINNLIIIVTSTSMYKHLNMHFQITTCTKESQWFQNLDVIHNDDKLKDMWFMANR